jgi:tight adherence protein B
MLLLPLVVGAITFAAAAFVAERRAAGNVGQRVAAYVAPRRLTMPTPEEQVLLSHYERTLAFGERQLRKLPYWPRYVALCERADAPLDPVPLFGAVAGGELLFSLLALAIGLPLALVALLLLVGAVGTRSWLTLRVSRRRRAFEEQLPELLMSLGSALRAGHGLTQALQSVAADVPEPVAGELTRVLAEARLGRSLDDALTDLGTRIDSRELDFVLDAIIVQRQVGGSLAGIFELVGDAVRQRQQFAMRLRSLTAMGRTSAMVLLALPVVLGAALSLMQHAYLKPLLTEPAGHVMLIGSFLLLGIGCLWLRRIVAYRG